MICGADFGPDFSIFREFVGYNSKPRLTAVALAYADMPGLVQTAHLVFASILLAVLLLIRYDYAAAKKNP